MTNPTAAPFLGDTEKTALRNANVAAFMTFSAFLGLGFALPFLPLFVEELGIRDPKDAAQWAGFLIGLGPLLAGLLSPFWGGLADRHGYRGVAVVALVALGLSQIVAALAQSPSHVLVSRVLSGLFGGVGPLGLAMATGARTASASQAIGRIQGAQILAAGFGPLLGGAFASTLGIRSAFFAAAVCCLSAACVVAWLYRDQGLRVNEPKAAETHAAPVAGAPVFFAALVAIVFLVNLASRSFTPILPGQIEDLGVSPKNVAIATGLLITVYSIAAAASSFALGRLAQTQDPLRLLMGSLLFSMIFAVAMAYVPSFEAFLGIALGFGLVSGGALTLGYSLGNRRFGEAARGAFFGKMSGAALIGGAVAPAVAGMVARSSTATVYAMNALIYVVLLVMALLLLREKRSPAS